MLEHKKRFSKKPAAAAPAKSAPAEPAKTVKPAAKKAETPAQKPDPKPVEAPKPVVAPKTAPKVETKPAAASKPAAKPAGAPKVEAQPAAPKVEAKPAAPKTKPDETKSNSNFSSKVDKLKNDIKSMPEQTLEFFANLLLWISIAVCTLLIVFGIIAAIAVKDANSPIILVGAIIGAVVAMIYPLIIWACIRVFVNISKTLMKIDAKIPAPKEEEK